MTHITLSWQDAEETTLLIDAERGWAWDEMFLITQRANEMILSKTHTVDSIYNFNQTTAPFNTALLSQMNAITRNPPPNAGKVYIVDSLAFGIKMVEIFTRISRGWADRIMVCKSMEQALEDIRKRRAANTAQEVS
jgi:hypothetical protein